MAMCSSSQLSECHSKVNTQFRKERFTFVVMKYRLLFGNKILSIDIDHHTPSRLSLYCTTSHHHNIKWTNKLWKFPTDKWLMEHPSDRPICYFASLTNMNAQRLTFYWARNSIAMSLKKIAGVNDEFGGQSQLMNKILKHIRWIDKTKVGSSFAILNDVRKRLM